MDTRRAAENLAESRLYIHLYELNVKHSRYFFVQYATCMYTGMYWQSRGGEGGRLSVIGDRRWTTGATVGVRPPQICAIAVIIAIIIITIIIIIIAIIIDIIINSSSRSSSPLSPSSLPLTSLVSLFKDPHLF